MKKSVLIISILAFALMVPLFSQAATIVDQDIKQATFDIVSNPNGETISIEANNLSFGEHTVIPSSIEAVTNTDSKIKVIEYSGDRPGWKLHVNMSKFTDTTGSALNNIKLFYPKVDPYTTMTGDFSAYKPDTLGPDSSFLYSLQGVTVNDDENNVLLASASEGKGFGEWILPYDGTNRIQLKIPKGQRLGTYKATLTYTIVGGP